MTGRINCLYRCGVWKQEIAHPKVSIEDEKAVELLNRLD